jgi:hypothetical protein
VHLARSFVASLIVFACLPAVANGAQSVSLDVGLSPERLGQSTTINFGVHITAPNDSAPSPLTELSVRYPSTIGLAASGLGVDTCSQQRLEVSGPAGCPANSHMGRGSALAEIVVGPETIRETAEVAVVRAPEQSGHLALLFFLAGSSPVVARLVFPSLLLPGPTPNSESVHIDVPLVPSFPGAPDLAVLGLHAAFGTRGLIYYEHVRGKLVAYRPHGILLPNKCPHGGFAFGATFGFLDGSHANARAVVPCPRAKRRRRP